MEEIRHVLAQTGANGFAVLTNSHGVYLVERSLWPVWAELDKCAAVLAIHPTAPCLRMDPSAPTSSSASLWNSSDAAHDGSETRYVSANPLMEHYMAPLIEYQFETARAVAHLLLSGTVARYPCVRYIVPHACGPLAPLINRIISLVSVVAPSDASSSASGSTSAAPSSPPLTAASIREALRTQFWFDLAGSPFPNQTHGLLPHLGPTLSDAAARLVYGSDFPWTSLPKVGWTRRGLHMYV